MDLRSRRTILLIAIPLAVAIIAFFIGQPLIALVCAIGAMAIGIIAYRNTQSALESGEAPRPSTPPQVHGYAEKAAPMAQLPANASDPWADWIVMATKYVRGLERTIQAVRQSGNATPLRDERTKAAEVVQRRPGPFPTEEPIRWATESLAQSLAQIARATSTPEMISAADATSSLLARIIEDQRVHGWVASRRSR